MNFSLSSFSRCVALIVAFSATLILDLNFSFSIDRELICIEVTEENSQNKAQTEDAYVSFFSLSRMHNSLRESDQ
jgi:hypothetical protein